MIGTYTEPRLNPKRDRVIMKCIAYSKGAHVVPKLIKDSPIGLLDVNLGLAANPQQFLMALTKRVAKLTPSKQKTFFANTTKLLEKQSFDYIDRLRNYTSALRFDRNKAKELVLFNKFKRTFFALGKENGVDLKRFFTNPM